AIADERTRLSSLLATAGRHDEAARLFHEQLVDVVAAGADAKPLVAELRGAARAPAGMRALADGLTLAAYQTRDDEAAAAWLREAAAVRGSLDDFVGAA